MMAATGMPTPRPTFAPVDKAELGVGAAVADAVGLAVLAAVVSEEVVLWSVEEEELADVVL